MHNEIEGDYDNVTINTFKSGLQTEHGLRKSLMGNLSRACASSWTKSTSIKGLRKTSSWEKVKRKSSLKRERISNQTDSITIDQGETLQGNPGPPTCKHCMLCSETQYIRSWKRSRMSHSSNGQTRWQEILRSAIRAYIANTT